MQPALTASVGWALAPERLAHHAVREVTYERGALHLLFESVVYDGEDVGPGGALSADPPSIFPYPAPMSRPGARPGDWKTQPFPETHVELPARRVYSPAEMTRIRDGLLPEERRTTGSSFGTARRWTSTAAGPACKSIASRSRQRRSASASRAPTPTVTHRSTRRPGPRSMRACCSG